jgi:hypothetical protein
MRIAQSPCESVPLAGYGVTERVVSLTEALVGLRHEVTLFASGDRRPGPAGAGMPHRDPARRTQPRHPPHHLRLMEMVPTRLRPSTIHFHTGEIHSPPLRRSSTPTSPPARRA